MMFLLNFIFALDIYINLIIQQNLFWPWHLMQTNITLGTALCFIDVFSIYIAWLWPAIELIIEEIYGLLIIFYFKFLYVSIFLILKTEMD